MTFFFHKLLMVLAVICLITGISSAIFFRQKRYWLKIHKTFNSTSVFFLCCGIIMAITMIAQQKGEHLEGFHPVMGAITLILAIISLSLGFYQFRAKSGRQEIKSLHRWLGGLTLLFLITAFVSGLIRAGII